MLPKGGPAKQKQKNSKQNKTKQNKKVASNFVEGAVESPRERAPQPVLDNRKSDEKTYFVSCIAAGPLYLPRCDKIRFDPGLTEADQIKR